MKQPSWKVPLILSFSLLTLGSLSYWLTYSHKPKKERSESMTKKPLPITDDSQIVRFRMKSSRGVIEGKCDSLAQKTCKIGATGEWSLTYPIQAKADSDTLRDLINNFSGMLATETVNLEEETPETQKQLLEEYGLSDSKRTSLNTQFIEFTLEEGKKWAAWFGEPHPVGDKTFVGSTLDGNLNTKAVFLIANFYKASFDKTLTQFRDKSVFHFNRSEIDSFQATTSSGKLEGKVENGLWTINGKPGDHDRIQTLFSAVSQLKVKDFITAQELRGAKPKIHFALHSKDKTYSFDIYEKKFKEDQTKHMDHAPKEATLYYLTASEQKEVFVIDDLFKSQVDKKWGELRESALLKQTEKLTASTLTLQGSAYPKMSEFHYDGKAWAQKDAGMKLDVGQIPSFLDLLIASHAKEILAGIPRATKTESFTMTLGDQQNPKKSQYLFFTAQGQLYAQDLNQKAQEVYLLDGNLKSALPFKPDAWKLK